MINWRTILKAPPSTQYSQYPQNPPASAYSEYIEEFEDRTRISNSRTHAPDVSAGNKEEVVQKSIPPDPPASPLPLHCFVTYTDSQGRLCGGWDERNACTVKQCHGVGPDCRVELAKGGMIPLRAVRAVGSLNAEGRLIAAWSVREHGYDGNGPFNVTQ